jgi:hypothetical protein
MWTRQVFFETILPKFRTLIATLPTDLSITAQLLLAEYHLVRTPHTPPLHCTSSSHVVVVLERALCTCGRDVQHVARTDTHTHTTRQKSMRVACPQCVFNTLAAEQNAHASGTASIKPWVDL